MLGRQRHRLHSSLERSVQLNATKTYTILTKSELGGSGLESEKMYNNLEYESGWSMTHSPYEEFYDDLICRVEKVAVSSRSKVKNKNTIDIS